MSMELADLSARTKRVTPTLRRPGLAAVGAVVAGLASISCCVLPLVFVLAGISGAWIGNLTLLSPWQPAFIAIAVGFVGYGHWAAYRARKARRACGTCERRLPAGVVDAGLWTGTILVALGAAVAYVMPLIMTE
jgi:mercuric ion transport protein